MAGHSKAEIVSALKAAFDNKQLPDLESGNMVFMMSKSAYLYDAGDHNGPHVMFFTALEDGKDGGGWRIGLASFFPVLTGSYRRRNRRRRKGCRRFLCSQSKLQSGPTERPHPCIKSRLTTTQSRHPTELRLGNPTGLPGELLADPRVGKRNRTGRNQHAGLGFADC